MGQAARGRDSGGEDSTAVVGEKGGLTGNHSFGFGGSQQFAV